MEANQRKMVEMESACNRYLDLREDQKPRLHRVQRLVSILHSGHILSQVIKQDHTETLARALAPSISLQI